MKAKTFLDQFINLGWRLETEEEQSGKLVWVLSNEAGAEILVVIHEDRKSFSTYSELIVPPTVEDVAIIQELMMPFVTKNQDCFWAAEALDVLCIERYYQVDVELPGATVDGRALRGVINRHLTLHKRAEENMQAAVEQLPSVLGPEYAHLMPENAIRIPMGEIHSAFPSLHVANAYFAEYLEKYKIREAEASVKLLADHLPDLILHNPCYRRYFREHGADAMVEKLVADWPALGRDLARRGVDDLLKYHLQDGEMNELDIRYMGRRETVEILGETFHGIADIHAEGHRIHTRTLVIQYLWHGEDPVGEESRMTWFAESEDQLPTEEEMKRTYDMMRDQPIEQCHPRTLPMVFETDGEVVAYLFTAPKK